MKANSSIILVLDNIRSAHNVGAIARSAAAFGVAELWCCGITPYPAVPGDSRLPHVRDKATAMIAKTALGAETMVRFSTKTDVQAAITELKQAGYQVYALEQARASVNIDKLRPARRFALVLGRELTGLSEQILAEADVIVEIPLPGPKKSLNVASAGAIALYCLTNQVHPS